MNLKGWRADPIFNFAAWGGLAGLENIIPFGFWKFRERFSMVDGAGCDYCNCRLSRGESPFDGNVRAGLSSPDPPILSRISVTVGFGLIICIRKHSTTVHCRRGRRVSQYTPVYQYRTVSLSLSSEGEGGGVLPLKFDVKLSELSFHRLLSFTGMPG